MARYRRNFIAGGTFFFTVKLADPKSRLLVEHIDLLRAAYMDVQKQYSFETVAVCMRCRTIFTPFGRCRPTMRIIPCAGG
ncbi:TPA: hypothetical protein ACFU2R_001947 [Neisseria subflava]